MVMKRFFGSRLFFSAQKSIFREREEEYRRGGEERSPPRGEIHIAAKKKHRVSPIYVVPGTNPHINKIHFFQGGLFI